MSAMWVEGHLVLPDPVGDMLLVHLVPKDPLQHMAHQYLSFAMSQSPPTGGARRHLPVMGLPAGMSGPSQPRACLHLWSGGSRKPSAETERFQRVRAVKSSAVFAFFLLPHRLPWVLGLERPGGLELLIDFSPARVILGEPATCSCLCPESSPLPLQLIEPNWQLLRHRWVGAHVDESSCRARARCSTTLLQSLWHVHGLASDFCWCFCGLCLWPAG